MLAYIYIYRGIQFTLNLQYCTRMQKSVYMYMILVRHSQWQTMTNIVLYVCQWELN